ncbi:odorant receptor 131-2-like [Girardinichthys multiradiatus]|uniref:odorant receptor 131-2-like n=1 Tax=Girardinichthys multiradiatus TaxID=208333 RepID=UPI001FAC0108|nr:odorant receptor 131-2-like [Girardinichthys multiradiatus]
MNDTEVPSMVQVHLSIRVLLTVLPSLIFLSINSIMLFALVKKPLFLESPRYILFGHLLLSDSLQLLLTTLLYIFALTMVRIITCICVIVTQLAAITVKMSPINLALMSLERYVAICFPLRHATIATSKAMSVAIAVMWTVASVDSFAHLFLFFSFSNRSLAAQQICKKRSIFQLPVYVILNRVFTVVNFVLVTVIIIYTYVAIMIAVKYSSSCTHRAKIAQKTVLLHALQLFLYLISTFFYTINSSELFNSDPAFALYIKQVLFLGLIIFPKFLSPLIYGLRDQTLRQVFKYSFTFGYKSSVEPYTNP